MNVPPGSPTGDGLQRDGGVGATGGVRGLTVVVAGAGSPSGVACAQRLLDAGAHVVAVGSDAERLGRAMQQLPAVDRRICDLADPQATQSLAGQLTSDYRGIDGLFHLVGGWRGGRGIEGQTDENYAFLHRSILTTLRNTSRAFHAPLAASHRGRLAVVSATAVDSPTAANASYAALKAAAETWVRAIADGLRKAQCGTGKDTGTAAPLRSAASILVVKALLDDSMREAQPERPFAGYTHVRDLAAAAVALFDQDAQLINGQRILLTGGGSALQPKVGNT